MAKPATALYNSDMITARWNVRIGPSGFMKAPPDWRWHMSENLPDYDMIVCLGGKGEYQRDERCFPARAGMCLIMRKGQRYVAHTDPIDRLDIRFIHFDFVNASGRTINHGEGVLPADYRILEEPEFFFRVVEKILAATLREQEDAAGVWMKAALLELLRQDAQPQWGGLELEQAEAVARLRAEIRQNPARPWRVHELAKRFHCTADHFGRLFQKYVGVSPGEFILRTRLNTAQSLLRSSSYSISRIADLLGYSDVYAFSRQFKQKTGATPTSYRRRIGEG